MLVSGRYISWGEFIRHSRMRPTTVAVIDRLENIVYGEEGGLQSGLNMN